MNDALSPREPVNSRECASPVHGHTQLHLFLTIHIPDLRPLSALQAALRSVPLPLLPYPLVHCLSSLTRTYFCISSTGDAVVSVDHKVPVDESLFEDLDDLDLEDK